MVINEGHSSLLPFVDYPLKPRLVLLTNFLLFHKDLIVIFNYHESGRGGTKSPLWIKTTPVIVFTITLTEIRYLATYCDLFCNYTCDFNSLAAPLGSGIR